jgi:hypothetical protein
MRAAALLECAGGTTIIGLVGAAGNGAVLRTEPSLHVRARYVAAVSDDVGMNVAGRTHFDRGEASHHGVAAPHETHELRAQVDGSVEPLFNRAVEVAFQIRGHVSQIAGGTCRTREAIENPGDRDPNDAGDVVRTGGDDPNFGGELSLTGKRDGNRPWR